MAGSKKREQQKHEITGIVFITLAVLCLLSLVNPSVGLLGMVVEQVLRSLAGEGRYLFPVLLAFWGIRLILLKHQKQSANRFSGGVLLFVAGLSLVHLLLLPEPYALRAGLMGEGGGLIGAICIFILQRSFGQAGVYIVLAMLILVGTLLSIDVSLSMLLKKCIDQISLFSRQAKEFLLHFLFTEVEEPRTQPVIIDHSGSNTMETDTEAPSSSKKSHVMVIRPEKEGFPFENTVKIPVEAEVLATADFSSYQLPPLSLLSKPARARTMRFNRDIAENIRILEETLASFGVNARVVQVSRGPVITRYEIQLPPGVKVSRIVGLADDVALCLAAPDVRIEAPIPGKAAVGIEVPNKEVSTVYLRELLETEDFQQATSCLTVALGKDIAGNPIVADLVHMPHLLIAGATGSGKSVCLNTLIASILFKATPSQVKFLIIDPKMVELSNYNGIPHLVSPVVTDPRKASTSLRWVVREMEYRYELFAGMGVRDINRYNALFQDKESWSGQTCLPYIVVIIDELSDLMVIAPADVEDAVCRLAQMARAAGIHLVVATQRPSVDVITGLIKANIPSRISFAVSSQVDSRTILDMAGAEKLLGKGDMLFLPVGASKPVRLQGAYLSDREVEALVSFLKRQARPNYDERFLKETGLEGSTPPLEDEFLPRAAELFIKTGYASISLLQRRLHIGYARAARLMDIMEKRGIIGSYQGSKPRAVLMTPEEYKQTFKA